MLGAHLTRISAGQHPAFDRIVFQFNGGIPGYDIRYVGQVVTDAKGDLVPLPGQAFLRIVFHSASGYRTYGGPAVISPVFPALLQFRAAGAGQRGARPVRPAGGRRIIHAIDTRYPGTEP